MNTAVIRNCAEVTHPEVSHPTGNGNMRGDVAVIAYLDGARNIGKIVDDRVVPNARVLRFADANSLSYDRAYAQVL